ncbi:hypothetical protein, partial [Streptomyces chromofuscus]|uniref:hypothetical protein n=1 Tax=Streptomyces chromofuscus TaxID=42881 RepID=UPI0027E47991
MNPGLRHRGGHPRLRDLLRDLLGNLPRHLLNLHLHLWLWLWLRRERLGRRRHRHWHRHRHAGVDAGG